MKTNTRRGKPNFIAISLFIGILAVVLIGFLDADPAYARGAIQLTSDNDQLDIRFISAATNDMGTGIDPGQAVHVGQCTAIVEGTRVDFRVNNGYPTYQCTLNVRLKNLSEKTVRLQQVVADIPDELVITQPDLPNGLVLIPEEEVTFEFVLRIQQNATENAKFRFSIQLIFEEVIG